MHVHATGGIASKPNRLKSSQALTQCQSVARGLWLQIAEAPFRIDPGPGHMPMSPFRGSEPNASHSPQPLLFCQLTTPGLAHSFSHAMRRKRRLQRVTLAKETLCAKPRFAKKKNGRAGKHGQSHRFELTVTAAQWPVINLPLATYSYANGSRLQDGCASRGTTKTARKGTKGNQPESPQS